MEKCLDNGFYCHLCRYMIKDSDLDEEWCCGRCNINDHWERVEVVMRSVERGALERLNKACENICAVDSEIDEN